MRVALAMVACLGLSVPLLSAADYDYAELLQHGLYFYEAQEAGRLSPGYTAETQPDQTLRLQLTRTGDG